MPPHVAHSPDATAWLSERPPLAAAAAAEAAPPANSNNASSGAARGEEVMAAAPRRARPRFLAPAPGRAGTGLGAIRIGCWQTSREFPTVKTRVLGRGRGLCLGGETFPRRLSCGCVCVCLLVRCLCDVRASSPLAASSTGDAVVKLVEESGTRQVSAARAFRRRWRQISFGPGVCHQTPTPKKISLNSKRPPLIKPPSRIPTPTDAYISAIQSVRDLCELAGECLSRPPRNSSRPSPAKVRRNSLPLRALLTPHSAG